MRIAVIIEAGTDDTTRRPALVVKAGGEDGRGIEAASWAPCSPRPHCFPSLLIQEARMGEDSGEDRGGER